MAKLYEEDAYSLGLLYAYLYSDRIMVLRDDLIRFHELIEDDLKESSVSDMNIFLCNLGEEIYFPVEGKNNDVYYMLKHDFDLKRAKSYYIGTLPIEILMASQKENVLNSIDLTKKDGHIVRKCISITKFENKEEIDEDKKILIKKLDRK